MTRYTFGIDPDSKEHGVALYADCELIELKMQSTPAIIQSVLDLKKSECEIVFSIEHSNKNSFMYGRNLKKKKGYSESEMLIACKVAMGVGKNQMAQLELCRWLDFLKIVYILNQPTKQNWANNKNYFEQLTGWTGRSNQDTRSAAYFGFIALDTRRRVNRVKQRVLAV